MAYKTIAPLVNAFDPSGRLLPFYGGSVIPWLNDAQRDHFLALGLVEEVGARHSADYLASPAPVEDAATHEHEQQEPAGAVERPAQVASKELWVAYAVSQGMEFAEADAMSKVDLIARFRD